MALDLTMDVVPVGLWPQGDIRDPLGVWGCRRAVTGDATGGTIKVAGQAPASIAGAYLYTCYSAIVAQLSLVSAVDVKCRLLTNWPDIDLGQIGVQGYTTLRMRAMRGSSSFTAPEGGPDLELILSNDRFLLLFDPRPVVGAFAIIELEIDENVNTETYTFEAWGYYWDRSVQQAPGGLRHPGSS